MVKTCNKCSVEKPLDRFHKAKHHKFGVYSACKDCVSQAKRLEYQNNGEAKKKYRRAYYTNNKDKCSQQMRDWRANNKEKERNRLLQRFYGITLEEFNRLFLLQDKKCAICGTEDPGKREWNVDHDHKTNTVRGILCGNCNIALGNFKDSIDSLYKAITYLRRHYARN